MTQGSGEGGTGLVRVSFLALFLRPLTSDPPCCRSLSPQVSGTADPNLIGFELRGKRWWAPSLLLAGSGAQIEAKMRIWWHMKSGVLCECRRRGAVGVGP